MYGSETLNAKEMSKAVSRETSRDFKQIGEFEAGGIP